MDKKTYIITNDIHKENATLAVMRIKPDKDKPLVVTIEQKADWKSREQEKLFHKLVSMFAEEMGCQAGDLKQAIKVCVIGYEQTINPLTGEVQEFLKSSAKYTKKEYTSLIDYTYQAAAERGIVLPVPDELYASYSR